MITFIAHNYLKQTFFEKKIVNPLLYKDYILYVLKHLCFHKA